MENTDGQPESTPGNEKVTDPNYDLTGRLERWVKERPITLFAQRRVRRNVANAITTDILNPVGTSNIPQSLENYRGHVNGAVATTIDKLSILPREEGGFVKASPLITDRATGIRFITRVKREGSAWISEEIGIDGKVISQAKIEDNGGLMLTLNFSDPKYEEKGANPKMIEVSGFPTGTKVLFLNHAASLGVIDWGGK